MSIFENSYNYCFYLLLLSIPKIPDIEKLSMYEMRIYSKRKCLGKHFNIHFYVVRAFIYII